MPRILLQLLARGQLPAVDEGDFSAKSGCKYLPHDVDPTIFTGEILPGPLTRHRVGRTRVEVH